MAQCCICQRFGRIRPNPNGCQTTTQALVEIGKESDETDVSFHLYEAARGLIEAIDLKTNFDRSAPICSEVYARQLSFSPWSRIFLC